MHIYIQKAKFLILFAIILWSNFSFGQLNDYKDVKQIYVDKRQGDQTNIFEFEEYKILVFLNFSGNKEISYDGNTIYSQDTPFEGTYFIKVDRSNSYLDHILFPNIGTPARAYKEGDKLYYFLTNSTDIHRDEIYSLDDQLNSELITNTEAFRLINFRIVGENLYFFGQMFQNPDNKIDGQMIPLDGKNYNDLRIIKYNFSNGEFDFIIDQRTTDLKMPKWDSSGNMYLTGNNTGSDGFTGDYYLNQDTMFVGPDYSLDAYLAKLNPDGENDYLVPFQEPGVENVTSAFEFDELGNVYFAMRFDADTLNIGDSFIVGDGTVKNALIKVNGEGELQWYNIFSSDEFPVVQSIAIGEEELVINVRLKDIVSINGSTENLEDSNHFVVRMNKDIGTILEIDRMIGGEYYFSNGISVANKEGYTHCVTVSSEVRDSIDFGELTFGLPSSLTTLNSSRFVYNTTLNSTNSLKDSNQSQYHNFVYPSIVHSRNFLNIREEYLENLNDIKLHSLDGRLLSVHGGNGIVSLPNLSAQMYTISATYKGQRILQKIYIY